MTIESQYLDTFLDPKSLNTKLTAAKKLASDINFDSIAFRGMSGALSAPALAIRMKKNLIMVRKPKDGSHSSRRVEGFTGSKKYIIVDDFIDSGNTICEIIVAVKKFSPKAKCLGMLSLKNSNFIPLNDIKKTYGWQWKAHFDKKV